MEITKDFLKNSHIIKSGTTGYIMRHNSGYTYKIYKSTYDFILKDTEYEFELNEIKKRLEYIVSQKDNVTLTILPKETLTYKNKPVGVEITYFNNSITLQEYLIKYPQTDLIKLKEVLLKIVNELIAVGIVPTDPNFENFLVTIDEDGKTTINMVDIDDYYVSVYPNGIKDIWYESEVQTCYRVLDLSFENIKQHTL